MLYSTNANKEPILSPYLLTENRKIPTGRGNLRKNGWVKRIAFKALKVVHLAEIYKKVHSVLSPISKRFAGEVRKPVANGSPRQNLGSGRRLLVF